jgi:hypothetical protein
LNSFEQFEHISVQIHPLLDLFDEVLKFFRANEGAETAIGNLRAKHYGFKMWF